MVKRSLNASKSGIKRAETALTDMGLTQQLLADALDITRQPVSKFFNGKPVSRDYFVRICQKLKLEWQSIAIDEEIPVDKDKSSEVDDLVEEIREELKPNIKKRCGFMRVLDMEQPIELTGERGIYTQVNY